MGSISRPSLITMVSQVASFWDLSRSRMFDRVCLVFFSPSSKIIFFFHFILHYLFNWILVSFFLACFLWNFLLVWKMIWLSWIFLCIVIFWVFFFTNSLNLYFFSWNFPSIFEMIFFKIIYKVIIIFLFHPLLFFYFEFNSHFLFIYFIWDKFLNYFYLFF
jgi:hypothetical protein